MSKTTEKRVLPDQIMNRVKACAILFLDSPRSGKINEIAETVGVSIDDAALMYTLGALKAARKRGTARNYAEALDALEAEQVGDRGSPITRTVSADTTARTIARINRINAGDQHTPDYTEKQVYPAYLEVLHTAGMPAREWNGIFTDSNLDLCETAIDHYPQPNDKKESTGRALGKVMGTLYTQWEAREIELDPAEIMKKAVFEAETAHIEKNLKLFFADYKSRLSKTAKQRLAELAESTVPPKYLMGKGRTDPDPDTRRQAWGAYRLYESFPHKGSITGREFIDLVRQYT